MKPFTLSYSSATLINVKDHMRRVEDRMANLYPSGYSFSLFKSNFNSTIDSEFSMKANHFNNCSTEEENKEEVGNLMEIKFPIHMRRMACIKPILRSNEDASTFMNRVQVDFKNAKMSQ